MKRRTVLACCLVSPLAGCVGTLGSRSEGERVQFERTESEYVLAIENDLAESVDVSASVADATGAVEEKDISVEPGDTTAVNGLLGTESAPYTVSVSARGDTTETVLEPRKSPYDTYTYTISSGGIDFRGGYRPTPGLVISNHLDRRVDVRVEVENHTNGNERYDIVTVSPDETSGFRGVFTDAAQYDVTVQSTGMTESITHRNSDTTSVWIRVGRDELGVRAGER